VLTLKQLSDKILRDESMDLHNCPWSINVPYTGTAPADLDNERRRRIYEAIRTADRTLRRWFHSNSPKTLLETIVVSIGPTEKPIPVRGLRYIELALDQDGRQVGVAGYAQQPALNLARYKLLGYNAPLPIAPYRILITRPGYWMLSPTADTKTLTVSFIREHGIYDKIIGADDRQPWTEYVNNLLVTHTIDTVDYVEYLPLGLGAGSWKFAFQAAGAPYLMATMVLPNLPNVRAGNTIDFWIKTTQAVAFQILLDDTAKCVSPTATLNVSSGIPLNMWTKTSIPIIADAAGLISLGLKGNGTPTVAGTVQLDGMTYSQPMDDIIVPGPDEYVEDLLPLAVRRELNFQIGSERWKTQEMEVQTGCRSFKGSDGTGETQTRLIVRGPP